MFKIHVIPCKAEDFRTPGPGLQIAIQKNPFLPGGGHEQAHNVIGRRHILGLSVMGAVLGFGPWV